MQSVIAGGLVLLTVTADRLFAHQVTRREWIGVGLAALGLAFLAATLEGAGDEAHSSYETLDLLIFLAAVSAGAIAFAVFGRNRPSAGVLLGASAGMFWAASDTAIKASSDALGDESWIFLVLSPLGLLILTYSIVGLIVSAKSLQIGKAVPVIALTSVAANSLTIAAGPARLRRADALRAGRLRAADPRLRARHRRRRADSAPVAAAERARCDAAPVEPAPA